MKKTTNFRRYDKDQLLLLPPDMNAWLPEGDLAYFIMDIVDKLSLAAFYNRYDASRGGQPPYNPHMMVNLLLYSYCVGTVSSRKIEAATYDSIAFRVITADQHPDHDTIAEFRKRHLKALAELFVQVLQICQQAGLVKLGHVALDGTKVRANASKNKAMSYGRMEKTAKELEEEVQSLLHQAQQTDENEDTKYGKNKRGDELPEELSFKQSRLRKIKEAMEALEKEAEVKAEARREDIRQQEEQLKKDGKNRRGKKPAEPDNKPKSKAQRNFTDPDSRIMKNGATKSFEQSYNAQAAVDSTSQVIVASSITQNANDVKEVVPMLEEIKENTGGQKPKKISADSGYFSEENVKHLQAEEVDAYIATKRDKHSSPKPESPLGRIPKSATLKERMERKLRTLKGRSTYSKRKTIVEPVFGQIKEARGLRRFSMRGLENVSREWDLICLTHNLLKVFRSGFSAKMA